MIADLIKISLDLIKDGKDDGKVKQAFLERLHREFRYNREILGELRKAKDKKTSAAFIGLLKTDISRFLDESMLSFKWFIRDVPIDIHDITKTWGEKNIANYRKWSQNIDTLPHLIERIYTRIEITKSLAAIGRIKNRSSAGYIEFLISVAQEQGY